MGTISSELAPYVARLSSRPRIYADANIPAGLVAHMRLRLGWDVLFVLEEDHLRRAPDVRHYRLARQLRRTLVTLDRDYLDDARFPPDEGAGVLVISAPNERQLLALLDRIDLRLFAERESRAEEVGGDLAGADGDPSLKGGDPAPGDGECAPGGADSARVGSDLVALPLAGRKLHVHTDWGRETF